MSQEHNLKNWAQLGFEIEFTGDQSPSLRLLQSLEPHRDKGEAMHHSGGAMSETELIYGSVISEAFAKLESSSFCVVGLGLGYIELIVAREAVMQKKSDFNIISFESVPELRDFFISWLSDKEELLSSEVKMVYEQVAKFVCGNSQELVIEVKKILQSKLCAGEFKIQGALEKNSLIAASCNVILYDAFSSKTSPHLWEEEFLQRFLKSMAASDVIFSTYAARGSLKKSLAIEGFQVLNRLGFMGKRNSTLGRRGLFTTEIS